MISDLFIFSRTRRAATVLAVVESEHIEVLAPAIQASSELTMPLLSVVKISDSNDLYKVRGVIGLAEHTKSPQLVEVRCSSDKIALTSLAYGAQAVSIIRAEHNVNTYFDSVRSIAPTAHAYGMSVVADAKLTDDPERFSHESDVDFVRLILSPEECNELELNTIQQWVRALKMPVIVGDCDLEPKHLRKLVHVGVIAVTVGNEIESALTAGLRTGLRNRSALRPNEYLRAPYQAVKSVLRSLHLNHKEK